MWMIGWLVKKYEMIILLLAGSQNSDFLSKSVRLSVGVEDKDSEGGADDAEPMTLSGSSITKNGGRYVRVLFCVTPVCIKACKLKSSSPNFGFASLG